MNKRITLIVTDASPLITLSVANALDTLLLPGVRVVIPDMVRYEVTRHAGKPGAKDLLDWIRAHDSREVFIGSTEVFEEFIMLTVINPNIKSKSRGEVSANRPFGANASLRDLSAAEILDHEIEGGVEAALLLFEDSDLTKPSFAMQMPSNVLLVSTSSFLDGLYRKNLIASADEILDRATSVRGVQIFDRKEIAMSGAEELVGTFEDSFGFSS